MCGITGIWDYKGELSLDTLKVFTDSLAHRGPDGAGYSLVDNNSLGLGHRRLSILDLSESAGQPMTRDSFELVFNGEIFNFMELKKELLELGHSFTTDSDTEVVITAYKEWGIDCLHKFNGMWAFALWDKEKEELLISADRYGIKPLYYSYNNNKLAFASETYAFNHLQGFKKQINWDNAQIDLEDPYVLEPLGHTIFKDIYRLLPGHNLVLKKGEQPTQVRWYDIRKETYSSNLSYLEACEKFEQLLRDSTKLRLRSDVPLATALSGGLDSSAVLGMVTDISKNTEGLERTPENLHQSFTMSFPGWANDESEYANEVLKFNNLEGSFLTISTNDIGNEIEEITRKSDFISARSLLPLFKLYSGMRQTGVTVSLDGHGVDEMLYGYKTMLWKLNSCYLEKGDLVKSQEMKEHILSLYPQHEQPGIVAYLKQLEKNSKGWRKLAVALKGAVTKSNKSCNLKSLSDNPYSWSEKDEGEIVNHYFFSGSLIPILRNFDKASMLAGVEVRMPFMDYRLVEFCFSLPTSYKVNKDFTKLILRDSLKSLLPEKIVNRKMKLGFMSPIDQWMDTVMDAKSVTDEELLEVRNNLNDKWKTGTLSKEEQWKIYNLTLIANGITKH